VGPERQAPPAMERTWSNRPPTCTAQPEEFSLKINDALPMHQRKVGSTNAFI